jgi:hypothetical protein
MITAKLQHKIVNRELDGYPIFVETDADNEAWIFIEHAQNKIPLPIHVVPELVEALQEHYRLVMKTSC